MITTQNLGDMIAVVIIWICRQWVDLHWLLRRLWWKKWKSCELVLSWRWGLLTPSACQIRKEKNKMYNTLHLLIPHTYVSGITSCMEIIARCCRQVPGVWRSRYFPEYDWEIYAWILCVKQHDKLTLVTVKFGGDVGQHWKSITTEIKILYSYNTWICSVSKLYRKMNYQLLSHHKNVNGNYQYKMKTWTLIRCFIQMMADWLARDEVYGLALYG